MNTATMLGLIVTLCKENKLFLGVDYDPTTEEYDVSFGETPMDRYHYDNTDLDELLQLVLDEIKDYTS